MSKDPTLFLEHVLESIELIEHYVRGMTREEFLESAEKQDAVLRRIAVIGEAVKSLPEEFRSLHQGVPSGS